MKNNKYRRSIEEMPRPAYILLRFTLMTCCGFLALSLLLFFIGNNFFPRSREIYHYALLFLENPAGALLIGAIGVAFILDRC